MISQQKIFIRGNTQSSKTINGGVGEYSESMPMDLIIDILSRLPSKSIARFRCVSKLWASMLLCPYFTELFLTRSSSRPQILFAFPEESGVSFFSIPQPQNHGEKSSPVAATYLTKTRFMGYCDYVSHINGLIFIRELRSPRPFSSDTMLLSGGICNPSTGQSLVIPKFSQWKDCFLGYDPIEKQYKILSITSTSYQVLTLGSENLLWRNILCSTDHYPVFNGICINGVLYYRALVNKPSRDAMVVCFDIRSEEFQFIIVTEKFSRAMPYEATLINYNGKLGSLMLDETYSINGRSVILELWVLEDDKKHEWSKHVHVLPCFWKNVAPKAYYSFVGVIGTDEIVFSMPNYDTGSFYVICYNMKKKSVAKVEIKGMEACKGCKVLTFLNHVEDLKLLF